MKTRHLSYWLIPTAKDSGVLQTVINELATRFETPSFPPHLTLFAGPVASSEEPRHLLDSLSPDLVPKRLAVETHQATPTSTFQGLCHEHFAFRHDGRGIARYAERCFPHHVFRGRPL